MCLAVPGRVLAITSQSGFRMGTIDFGGVVKEVCLEYVPDIQVGEYAIVHVGFAIKTIDEEAAKRALQTLAEIGQLEESLEELRGAGP